MFFWCLDWGSPIEVNYHMGVSTSAIFELPHTASLQFPGATLDQDFWEDPILLLGSFLSPKP